MVSYPCGIDWCSIKLYNDVVSSKELMIVVFCVSDTDTQVSSKNTHSQKFLEQSGEKCTGMNQSAWIYYKATLPSELAILTAILLLMIIITNILTLITFRRMEPLPLINYSMGCLAVVDLLTVLPHIPGFVGIIQGYLVLTKDLCDVIVIANHSAVGATTWIHCAICIEKCFSILRPISHRMFIKRYPPCRIAISYTLLSTFLILGIMTSAVLTGFVKAVFDTAVATCMIHVDMNFFVIVGSTFIFIPLTIVFVTHMLILNELRKSNTARRKQIRRATKTVALTVGIYYLCWTPISVTCIWWVLPSSERNPPAIFEFVSPYFILANSTMNFFIYLSSIREFKAKFKDMCCRKTLVQPS